MLTPQRIVLLFVTLMTLVPLQAQLFEPEYFRGRIIDDSTGNRVSWVNIFNESRREWYTSDGEGRFNLPLKGNDTLVFRAMGFLGKVVIVDATMSDSFTVVRMAPRYYEIGEVAIRAFRSYEDFKQEFKTYRVQPTEQEIMRESFASMAASEGKAAFEEKVIEETIKNSGQYTIATVPILSKEDKFMIRYNKRMEEEEVQRQIDKKYNREIIARVTGLPEDEITDFMVFCNFSTAYLTRATELQIIELIRDKLALYLKMQKSGFYPDTGESDSRFLG
ncbi:MAG: hypothetical protein ACOYXB_02515 [Bacteroidota bacterium]